MRCIRGLAVLCTGAAALAAQAAQFADDYPRKPVRLIVPTAPGGPVDIVARIIVPGLSAELGQPFVIDNRAGAGGIVGAEMVARALPDGYTLLMTHSGLLGLAPMMFTPPPYDSIRDFSPVSVAAAMPMLLLANPALAAKSVPELVALAKAQPGKLNFASGGTGTGIHVAFELFNMTTGIKLTHVPYKGAAPGMTGVMAGEADLTFNGLPSALPFIKAGRLRALAVGGARRTPLLPALPTVAESGIGFDYSGWFAAVAPARTAPAIAARLHDALANVLARAEMKEQLSGQGIEPIGSTPAQFAVFLREENSRLEKVVVAAGLRQNK
jgi:tripartite-type tricarboxylate transporter receptor subunit TctC